MSITALGIGSGLDLAGLLDQLKDGERQKLEPIVQQQQGYQSKISAYGKLEGLLSQFQTATEKLNDASLFQSTKSSVDGDAVQAAATDDADVGSYSVDVDFLARAYSVATDGVADKTDNLGAGTLTVELQNGESLSATVEADSSSLEDVRDAINSQDGGVRASIVNDGSGTPYRLSLTSATTGTEAAISSVDFGTGDLSTSLAVDATTEITAQDASLTVNGVAITSQTNQVEEAIQGVTLSLQEGGSATLNISKDTDSIEGAIKGFVTAYNKLQESMSDLTRFDAETGSAGTLLGDSTLRSVQSYMRSTMSSGAGEGSMQMLSDVGINLQLDGTLKLDEDKVTDLVANEPAALSEFFAGEETGLGDRLDQTLEQILMDRGVLDTATSGLETSIERLDERYARTEETIESTIARYRNQFSQLDSMIAEMNSTSDYLTQQFANMNAQLGQS